MRKMIGVLIVLVVFLFCSYLHAEGGERPFYRITIERAGVPDKVQMFCTPVDPEVEEYR